MEGMTVLTGRLCSWLCERSRAKESRRPLRNIWNLNDLVVGEVELLEAGQLKKAVGNGSQIIMLQIQFDHLYVSCVYIILL